MKSMFCLIAFLVFSLWNPSVVCGVSFNTTSKYGEYLNTGEDDLHLWAVNIPNVTFTVHTDVVNIPASTSTIRITLTLNTSVEMSGNVVALDDSQCIPNPTTSSNFLVNCEKADGEGLIITATIIGVSERFNFSVLKLMENAGSIPGFDYPQSTLILKGCGTNTFLNAEPTSSDVCGYSCEMLFNCTSNSDQFARICEADAEWNNSTSICPEPITTTLPTTTITAAIVTTSTASAVTSITTAPKTRNFNEERKITGGVLLGFSLAALVAYIILIVLMGFIDFIKENALIFTSGVILLVISIACGIVLIALTTDESWGGGDIAAAVIGYIGLAVIILFEIYLGLSWKSSDYAKGHEK